MYILIKKIINTAQYAAKTTRWVFGGQMFSNQKDLIEYQKAIEQVLIKFNNKDRSNSPQYILSNNKDKTKTWVRFPSPKDYLLADYPQQISQYVDVCGVNSSIISGLKRLAMLDHNLAHYMFNENYNCDVDFQILKFDFEKFKLLYLTPLNINITPDCSVELVFKNYHHAVGKILVEIPVGLQCIMVNGQQYRLNQNPDINFFYMYFKQIADDMYVSDLYYQYAEHVIKNFYRMDYKTQLNWKRRNSWNYYNAHHNSESICPIVYSFDSLEFFLSL